MLAHAFKSTAVGLLATAVVFAYPAGAQDLPPTHIKAVGAATYMAQRGALEEPFFGKTLPAHSKGKVTADLLPYDTVGLSGPEVLRLLKVGALEFARGDLIVVSGDEPRFDGADLAGIAQTMDDIRRSVEVYRPVIAGLFDKNWNARLLSLSVNPPQVMWCNAPIKGLADIKGLKVRVSSKTVGDFIQGAGGTPVQLPSAEVLQALQRKVVDCAVTGTTTGNGAKWPEVATHLYPIYLGWAIQFWAVNNNTWNRMDKGVQAFLTAQFKTLEQQIWDLQKTAETQGIICSTGMGECTMQGLNKYKMTLVPVTDADKAAARKIVAEHVVPNWAKRCGKACADEWNGTVGKQYDLKASAQ